MPTVFVSVHSAKFTFAIFLLDKTHNVKETFCRPATMMRMGTELQRAAQEWDPLMCRSLQFSNIIEGCSAEERESEAVYQKNHIFY